MTLQVRAAPALPPESATLGGGLTAASCQPLLDTNAAVPASQAFRELPLPHAQKRGAGLWLAPAGQVSASKALFHVLRQPC